MAFLLKTPTLLLFAGERRLTHHVVALEAQLAGLAGLEDLHPDELDLRPAVLEHLLGGR